MRMVQGSTEPSLQVTLTGETGPVELSTATKVEVRGELHDTQLFRREVPGPLADDGLVDMLWVDGDTDQPGRIWVDVLVTWPGDRLQWFRSADVVDVEPL